MNPTSGLKAGWIVLAMLLGCCGMTGAAPAEFSTEKTPDRVVITYEGRPVAHFVFRDEQILRPHFANLCTLEGVKVTRNHPPIEGVDAMDHGTMHPGLWLAFGDISGVDFWRNKGRIEHVRFLESPARQAGRLRFATECRLVPPEGTGICTMTNRFMLAPFEGAWLLIWEATFRSEAKEFSFGDQEEMGFGARVATALSEKKGGLITSSGGERTAARTWGKAYDWCDYSGSIEGRRVGLMLVADPDNFRRSWWHNRDYGLMVANPFGRQAMKQGAKSVVTVKPGETFGVCFGAVIYSSNNAAPINLTGFYEKLLMELAQHSIRRP